MRRRNAFERNAANSVYWRVLVRESADHTERDISTILAALGAQKAELVFVQEEYIMDL